MSALRLAVLLAVLASAGPAQGYVRNTTDDGRPFFWDSPIVSYWVNTPDAGTFSPTCAAAGGPALDTVRASFETWQQPCTHLRLQLAGVTDEIRVGETGSQQNVVVFREGFCAANPDAVRHPCFTNADIDCGNIFNCFDDPGGTHGTLALTSVLFVPQTGRIVDADMEIVGWDGGVQGTTLPPSGPLHGWYFTCTAGPSTRPCTTYGQAGCHYVDLQNTVTHEVGHFIGLRHPCFTVGSSPSDADLPNCLTVHEPTTMYPIAGVGDFDKRSLDADDVAGVCAAYPESDGRWGCGSGGPPGAVALAALLALAALRPWRRRAR